ncbi:tetraacyldisaccharide 4'-kinase [Planktomarina temperata]|nr:tetraacyldisaccharide 4'-kinase [Planktomarina temperata]
MIRTPQFWHQPPGVLAYGLWPLGWLYGAATAWRQSQASQAHHARCPVICVGNINAGGTQNPLPNPRAALTTTMEKSLCTEGSWRQCFGL